MFGLSPRPTDDAHDAQARPTTSPASRSPARHWRWRGWVRHVEHRERAIRAPRAFSRRDRLHRASAGLAQVTWLSISPGRTCRPVQSIVSAARRGAEIADRRDPPGAHPASASSRPREDRACRRGDEVVAAGHVGLLPPHGPGPRRRSQPRPGRSAIPRQPPRQWLRRPAPGGDARRPLRRALATGRPPAAACGSDSSPIASLSRISSSLRARPAASPPPPPARWRPRALASSRFASPGALRATHGAPRARSVSP
jgi:hypothetical protein